VSQTSAQPTSLPIAPWPRLALAFTGAASFVAGSVAVFVSTNAAATALIGSGLVLGFLAATGRLPLRWSAAGVVVDVTPEQLAVDVMSEELPADKAEEVLKIAAAATSSPDLAHAASKRLWETQVFQAIRRGTPGDAHITFEGSNKGDRYDIVVKNDRRTVLIDVHYGPAPHRVEEHFPRGVIPTKTHLHVTTQPSPKNRHVVIWKGPDDDAALAEAIRQGLA
jgi:hypothetical protein